MNKDANYAFYGTLRTGMENNLYYGSHALESRGIIQLKGYLLYSLGEYPYAIKTPDLNRVITVELFHINDFSIEKEIHEMELSVDYYFEEVLFEEDLYGIYLFRTPREGDILLQHGDWVKFMHTGLTF